MEPDFFKVCFECETPCYGNDTFPICPKSKIIKYIKEKQEQSQPIESAKIDINVGPITQVIREFADDLEYHAKNLITIAKDMDNVSDISFGIDALIEINQAFSSLRIDLLLRRTIKELQKNK